MTSHENSVSVILPTFNEKGNILSLIKKIDNKLSSYPHEIILVDDNSPDGTFGLVKKVYGNSKTVKIFKRTDVRGLAGAICFGINQSSGKYIIIMDTDFNHDPDEIPRLLSEKKEFDLVIGSRYIKGGGMENKLRFILSLLYNLIIKITLRLSTSDNLSGFFLIKKKTAENLDKEAIFRGYGDYFMRLIKYAHDNKLKIKEIPVYYKNRYWGASKTKFIRIFIDYSKTLIQIINSK